MKQPGLSVIIPNYNGKLLLENNLPSVFAALQQSGIPHEVLIVDDCSTDDSVEFIDMNYPNIKRIKKEKNTGFSATCNVGIALARYPYIMLLNTDIQLSENYFTGQLDYFNHKDTFGVMAKIKGAKQGEVQDTARLYTFNGFKIKANRFFRIVNPTGPIPTAYLSGANAIIDAEKLRALGGFNENFSPFYYEDFDLCLRAWRMGWKCYYHPLTFCLHDHSSTTRNYRSRNWVKSIFFRNRFIMHAIHLEQFQLLGYYLQLFVDALFMWMLGKFYFYKALYQFIILHDEIRKSRESLHKQMKVYTSTRSVKDIQQEMTDLLDKQVISYGLGDA
ncbi:MAG: glycosyltransferase family 2 protein [Sphingobacteriaceae bacterium]|nr:glycosyltransferase family 2 protein [Sphingobacteriaceae bacterium]